MTRALDLPRAQTGRALVGLLLVLAMLLVPAVAQASWGLPGGTGLPPVDDGGSWGEGFPPLTPPRAPVNPQTCMDDLIKNYQRCKSVHCVWLLWVAIDCNEYALGDCHQAAEQTFQCCMTGCLDGHG